MSRYTACVVRGPQTGHTLYIKRSYETVSTFGQVVAQEVAAPLTHEDRKMQLTVVFGVVIIGLGAANPHYDSQPRPQIIRNDIYTDDMPNSYKFSYDADDGSSRTEQGAILNPGTDDAALDVQGAVRWYDNKGHLYEMTYKAGKRGYRTIIKKIS